MATTFKTREELIEEAKDRYIKSNGKKYLDEVGFDYNEFYERTVDLMSKGGDKAAKFAEEILFFCVGATYLECNEIDDEPVLEEIEKEVDKKIAEEKAARMQALSDTLMQTLELSKSMLNEGETSKACELMLAASHMSQDLVELSELY